ncbi:hypothetical protein E3J84_04485 [Candidatus Aerophobetes bacterium]|uniref:Uncharacterized protein n=1 Tax=Aerophobetes bacterium TaxID=2030807 RepID=A0A523RWD6_UNCAE|nr:MAG: hypothetical protein E3J84_04485 [Candidatus Aerophobetes bacterium]
MSSKQEIDESASFLLTSDDRANGFSIVVDEFRNTRLLAWGYTVASFSERTATPEVVRGFLDLIKAKCLFYVAP